MLDLKNTWAQNEDANNISLRRRLLMSAPLAAFPLVACSQSSNSDAANANNVPTIDTARLSAEDAELKHRFRGIYSGELISDGLVEMNSVALHNELGDLIRGGTFSPKNRGRFNYGGSFVVPKTIRMMWFSDESIGKRAGSPPPAFEGGTIRADVTVPVASRFPIEVLDEARKKGAGLRLKLRVHPEGVLVGWDIERRPGYEKYTEKEIRERNLHFPPVYSFTGGDFKEARGVYVNAIRSQENGWYIHPKTGQKIETDF